MQLYFLRHGQSINNANWDNPAYIESPDPILTEAGILQASLTAEHFEKFQPITDSAAWNPHNRYGYGITHIYTSMMERAAHTASFTARRLNVPFMVWEEIHESGGIFTRTQESRGSGLPGRSRVWFEANIPELTLPATLDGAGWWNRPLETEEECQVRAQRVWTEVLARHRDLPDRDEQRILFVSHGGFFVHLLCAILNLPWRNASHELRSWFMLNNCAISRLDVHKDEVSVCYLNRTDHLPAHLIT
jgi:2,3-bisphosphoglycerate-dependent phosphoglycerate mutase